MTIHEIMRFNQFPVKVAYPTGEVEINLFWFRRDSQEVFYFIKNKWYFFTNPLDFCYENGTIKTNQVPEEAKTRKAYHEQQTIAQ